MMLHRYDADVWSVAGALTQGECAEFIAHGGAAGFDAVMVALAGGAQMCTDLRNNDRATVDDEILADTLWERMREHAPAEIDGFVVTRLNPRFWFYRYEPGQQFKRHLDGRVHLPTGEVSRLTLLFYLNDGCEGGETVFSDWGFTKGKSISPSIRITPAAGTALFFTHEIWHEGAQVTVGRKYVLRTDVLYAGDGTVYQGEG